MRRTFLYCLVEVSVGRANLENCRMVSVHVRLNICTSYDPETAFAGTRPPQMCPYVSQHSKIALAGPYLECV